MNTKILTIAASVLAAALLLACPPTTETDDDPPGPFSLTFNGTGYDPHDGQTMWTLLLDDTGAEVERAAPTTVAGGTFTVTFDAVLEHQGSYTLQWIVDLNGNGFCDDTPTDHSWEAAIDLVMDDVVFDHTHDISFTDVCDNFNRQDSFDLTVSGNGYDPHDGQTLSIVVLDSTGAEVGADSATVAGGAWSFTWPGGLLEGETYTVQWYVDLDGSGACDAPPTDHAWERSVPAVADNVTIDHPHDTNFTDVCASF